MLKNDAYVCNNTINTLSTCVNKVEEPQRFIIQIPEAIKRKYAFLNRDFDVETRLLYPAAKVSNTDNNENEDLSLMPGNNVRKIKSEFSFSVWFLSIDNRWIEILVHSYIFSNSNLQISHR